MTISEIQEILSDLAERNNCDIAEIDIAVYYPEGAPVPKICFIPPSGIEHTLGEE